MYFFVDVISDFIYIFFNYWMLLTLSCILFLFIQLCSISAYKLLLEFKLRQSYARATTSIGKFKTLEVFRSKNGPKRVFVWPVFNMFHYRKMPKNIAFTYEKRFSDDGKEHNYWGLKISKWRHGAPCPGTTKKKRKWRFQIYF